MCRFVHTISATLVSIYIVTNISLLAPLVSPVAKYTASVLSPTDLLPLLGSVLFTFDVVGAERHDDGDNKRHEETGA